MTSPTTVTGNTRWNSISLSTREKGRLNPSDDKKNGGKHRRRRWGIKEVQREEAVVSAPSCVTPVGRAGFEGQKTYAAKCSPLNAHCKVQHKSRLDRRNCCHTQNNLIKIRGLHTVEDTTKIPRIDYLQ